MGWFAADIRQKGNDCRKRGPSVGLHRHYGAILRDSQRGGAHRVARRQGKCPSIYILYNFMNYFQLNLQNTSNIYSALCFRFKFSLLSL